ncbi:MAG: hypothetical protein JSU72_18705, partial [Deltaproteobacteria bacterium]
GHAVVMGRRSNDWQDRDYVLQCFGNKEGETRKAYRQFVKEGSIRGADRIWLVEAWSVLWAGGRW